MTSLGGVPRAIPERDSDPTRGLVPPPGRAPQTDEAKQLASPPRSGAGLVRQENALVVPASFSPLH